MFTNLFRCVVFVKVELRCVLWQRARTTCSFHRLALPLSCPAVTPSLMRELKYSHNSCTHLSVVGNVQHGYGGKLRAGFLEHYCIRLLLSVSELRVIPFWACTISAPAATRRCATHRHSAAGLVNHVSCTYPTLYRYFFCHIDEEITKYPSDCIFLS